VRIFRCDHCGHPVFFENVQCLHCGSALAFLPDRMFIAAIEELPDTSGLWRRKSPRHAGRQYRMCHNHGTHQACNFAVPAHDPNPLCVSCRQTRILPDLSVAANQERWYRIEVAKRRLYYTLAHLGLAPADPGADQPPAGPVYEFLADQPGMAPVLTGHRNGVITLNVAEADDDERTRRRMALYEPYRTLLGHLRHESGHYYWDSLIAAQPERHAAFREVFGDDSLDYGMALSQHYANGPSATSWQADYVSAYATAHPWEDWAETWAHYLHMVDLLETASAYNTRVVVPGDSPDEAEEVCNPFAGPTDFDQLVTQWVPVTLLLNSLNRSLGQNDAYPFALTPGALRKLRFVHDVIHGASGPS
jgi:hypothetical protein